jgi:hypothetical protein
LPGSVVRQVVNVQVCLNRLPVSDLKRTASEYIPLQQPWAPDLANATIRGFETVGRG